VEPAGRVDVTNNIQQDVPYTEPPAFGRRCDVRLVCIWPAAFDKRKTGPASLPAVLHGMSFPERPLHDLSAGRSVNFTCGLVWATLTSRQRAERWGLNAL